MDNDLPAEPNDFMAATYAELACKNRREADREPDPTRRAQLIQTAIGYAKLADAYDERRNLTTGYHK